MSDGRGRDLRGDWEEEGCLGASYIFWWLGCSGKREEGTF